MTDELPTPANDDDLWTELFGASLALEDAGDLDPIAACRTVERESRI